MAPAPLCVLLALAAVSTALVTADGDGAKSRRITGMFPRPIVGRGDPSVTWRLLDVSEIAELDEKSKRGNEAEISGLYAYPRVGRSDPLFEAPQERPRGRYHAGVTRKRDGASGAGGDNANGLWFGPRLGRAGKREKPEGQSPWALIALREYPTGGRRQDTAFTPRLGRESGEDPGEDDHEMRLHAETV